MSLIRNHTKWVATDGNLIDCHEGGIIRVGDTFYWHGRSYRGNIDGIYGTAGAKFRCGFRCYRSTNLVNWTFAGPSLEYPQSGWLTEGTWHRPRVIYNALTKKFVLWFFLLGIPEPDNVWVKDVVAVSDVPEGPFTILGERAISGMSPSGDLALLLDYDGKGYMGNGDWDRNCLVVPLTENFRDTTGTPVMALQTEGPNKGFEGACLARYKGKYLCAGSRVVGLNPSETTYSIADHPMGPYVLKGVMSNPDTWRSQIGSFFYIKESDCLMALCDQWLIGPDGNRVSGEESCQLWMPVAFDPVSGIAKMDCRKEWDPFDP
jgi:hypothetical protein